MAAFSGVTLVCQFCERPIVTGYASFGQAGEPYHTECTRPPEQVMTKEEMIAIIRQAVVGI